MQTSCKVHQIDFCSQNLSESFLISKQSLKLSCFAVLYSWIGIYSTVIMYRGQYEMCLTVRICVFIQCWHSAVEVWICETTCPIGSDIHVHKIHQSNSRSNSSPNPNRNGWVRKKKYVAETNYGKIRKSHDMSGW